MSTILTENPLQEGPSPAASPQPEMKRVVIIGGGFAGLATPRTLKRSDGEITLVDRRDHHIFRPLLYQVATAILAPLEIASPLRRREATQLASDRRSSASH